MIHAVIAKTNMTEFPGDMDPSVAQLQLLLKRGKTFKDAQKAAK